MSFRHDSLSYRRKRYREWEDPESHYYERHDLSLHFQSPIYSEERSPPHRHRSPHYRDDITFIDDDGRNEEVPYYHSEQSHSPSYRRYREKYSYEREEYHRHESHSPVYIDTKKVAVYDTFSSCGDYQPREISPRPATRRSQSLYTDKDVITVESTSQKCSPWKVTGDRQILELQKELEELKQQKKELQGTGSRSPSPDTKRFLKENTKLQLEIQNKLKTIRRNDMSVVNGVEVDQQTNTEPQEPACPEKKPKHKWCQKFNYIFYDPELHWCRACNVFPQTAKDYLTHLHSPEHEEAAAAHVESPWQGLPGDEGYPSLPDVPDKRTPIRGLQFFVPATAWFCKLCDRFVGDLTCASAHIKSLGHSKNYNQAAECIKYGTLTFVFLSLMFSCRHNHDSYLCERDSDNVTRSRHIQTQKFVQQNPHWETDWVSDRQKAFEQAQTRDKHTTVLTAASDTCSVQYVSKTVTICKDVRTKRPPKTPPLQQDPSKHKKDADRSSSHSTLQNLSDDVEIITENNIKRNQRDHSREKMNMNQDTRDNSDVRKERCRKERDRSREKNDRSRENNDRSRENNDRSRDNNDRSRDNNYRSRDNNERSRENNDRSRENNDRSRDDNDRSRERKARSQDRKENTRDDCKRSRDRRENSRERRVNQRVVDRYNAMDGKGRGRGPESRWNTREKRRGSRDRRSQSPWKKERQDIKLDKQKSQSESQAVKSSAELPPSVPVSVVTSAASTVLPAPAVPTVPALPQLAQPTAVVMPSTPLIPSQQLPPVPEEFTKALEMLFPTDPAKCTQMLNAMQGQQNLLGLQPGFTVPPGFMVPAPGVPSIQASMLALPPALQGVPAGFPTLPPHPVQLPYGTMPGMFSINLDGAKIGKKLFALPPHKRGKVEQKRQNQYKEQQYKVSGSAKSGQVKVDSADKQSKTDDLMMLGIVASDVGAGI